MNREAIYSALFDLVASVPGIKTSSRRVKVWTEVPDTQQPALFMAQIGEICDGQTSMPTKWRLQVELYLYVKTQNAKQSPSSVFNPIVDQIISIIMPDSLANQTLGGLVHYCRVSGQIQTDEGALGDQAVVIIPIEIFAL